MGKDGLMDASVAGLASAARASRGKVRQVWLVLQRGVPHAGNAGAAGAPGALTPRVCITTNLRVFL